MRLIKLLVAAFLAAGLAAPAEAHGPPRKKVTETVEINLPPEKVWAVVGNFQDMGWHPAVEKTEGTGGNEPNATRTLTLQGGGQIHERLEKHDPEKMTLFYFITEVDVKVLPVTNYQSWLTVKPAEGGKSLVEWRGAFYRGYPNNDPPPELNDDAAIQAVTAVYRAGLDNLKKTLEAKGS